MNVNRRLFQIVPTVRGRIAMLVVLMLITTATYVGQGVLIARIIARVFDGSAVASLTPEIAAVVGLVLIRSVSFIARELIAVHASGLVRDVLRERLVDKIFDFGPAWTQAGRTGAMQTTLVDGVETLDAYIGRFLPQRIAAVVGAAAVTGYIFTLDHVVGLVILGCSLLAPLLPTISKRMHHDRMATWTKSYRSLYSENLDAIQGMSTLKAFNASRRRGEQLDRDAQQFSTDSLAVTAAVIVYIGIVAFIVGGGTGFAVGLGSVRLADGDLARAELLTILLLTRECFRPLNDLEKAYHSSYPAIAVIEDILDMLDAPVDVAGPARVVPVAPTGAAPSIELDDVTYAYRSDLPDALHRVSLRIEPGQRVAVVGPSGAGKTTIVSLILRFRDPSTGSIRLNGRDMREIGLDELRAQIAVVSQSTYLFHGTVRRNLLVARPTATDDELHAAATAARAREFITELSDGYDTVIGERGLKLSGGQRQRLSIARALLKDAPVLILDEATSSVDAENEAAIQSALEILVRGRTTLVIAHRLSTVRDADRILVLEDGRLVEAGAHDELVSRGGTYSALVATQDAWR